MTTPLNMNRAIFDHLDTLFPAPGGQVIGEPGGGGRNGFVNGAQGGMGMSYSALLVLLLLLSLVTCTPSSLRSFSKPNSWRTMRSLSHKNDE